MDSDVAGRACDQGQWFMMRGARLPAEVGGHPRSALAVARSVGALPASLARSRR